MKCEFENKCKNCIGMPDGCYFTGKAIWNERCLYFIDTNLVEVEIMKKGKKVKVIVPIKATVINDEPIVTKATPENKKTIPKTTKSSPNGKAVSTQKIARKYSKKTAIHEV